MGSNRRLLTLKNYAESASEEDSYSSPPPSPPSSTCSPEKEPDLQDKRSLKDVNLPNITRSSPPHKIQSLDEKSNRLNENYVVTPTPPPNIKAISSRQTNSKSSGESKQPKLTDYFVQRRSNRKTKEALNNEKHQLLAKLIIDGTQDGLKVNRFGDKGRGVVASKRFLHNEFVVEYHGELLSIEEASAREDKYAKDSETGCYMYYFQHNGQQYCVDATKESDRLGRLINHSRNGNLVTKVVEVKGSPRLILIAKRDIKVGEELSYDYGDRSQEALRNHPWLAY